MAKCHVDCENPNRNLRVEEIKQAIVTAAMETPNVYGSDISVDTVWAWITEKMSKEQIIELYTKMHNAWEWCRIYK